MNYSRLLLCFVLLLSYGASAQQQSEERHIPFNSPNNSLENPASYANVDHYKAAKAKDALIYGRDYIFEGMSANEVSQQLIDDVDPYNYLNQMEPFEKVFIEVEEHNLTLIFFPYKVTKLNEELNENE